MADEFGAGMLTMIAAPDFSILKSNIDEVRNFCGHFRKQYGNIYVMDDGTFKYIHSRAMESFANNIDDVPVEAENMINEMDEYISWLFPFIIDISNGLKDAKECVRQAKKKIPPRTVQEKESIGSDQCKIETLKNKSIVERRIFSKVDSTTKCNFEQLVKEAKDVLVSKASRPASQSSHDLSTP